MRANKSAHSGAGDCIAQFLSPVMAGAGRPSTPAAPRRVDARDKHAHDEKREGPAFRPESQESNGRKHHVPVRRGFNWAGLSAGKSVLFIFAFDGDCNRVSIGPAFRPESQRCNPGQTRPIISGFQLGRPFGRKVSAVGAGAVCRRQGGFQLGRPFGRKVSISPTVKRAFADSVSIGPAFRPESQRKIG